MYKVKHFYFHFVFNATWNVCLLSMTVGDVTIVCC